jgi:RNA polymerase primary sigma factor/RNA polymerase sigma factor
VDSFLAQNKERVTRGTLFSRMTGEQRDQIIERARCLTQAGECRVEVTRRIAQEIGRSAETVRYTLTRFNMEHSDMAIRPYHHHPPQNETKQQILQEYRRGESVVALAERFNQTRTQIYRIINDLDVVRIMALPLDYIGNEQFTRPYSEDEEREILKTLPENDPPAKRPRVPGGLPAYLAGLYEIPLLTREQEVHLFRKMNYLKYKASTLRAQLDPNRPANRLMRRLDALYDESASIKAQIVRANLRLVVSIAKRHVGPAQDFFELVSDGNMSLLRAANKFDFSRGNRFSTYATWAIMKNFARTIHAAARHRDRFCTNHSEMFSYTEDVHTDPNEQETSQIKRESQVEKLLNRLDERERQIVTARFGLTRGQESLTLAQVGSTMGVTKERIRQIQVRAMGKLRAAAEEASISI